MIISSLAGICQPLLRDLPGDLGRNKGNIKIPGTQFENITFLPRVLAVRYVRTFVDYNTKRPNRSLKQLTFCEYREQMACEQEKQRQEFSLGVVSKMGEGQP